MGFLASGPMTVYFYTLLIAGALTIVMFFLQDLLDAVFEAVPLLNPTLILAFITLGSAAGFGLEAITGLSSLAAAVIAAVFAIIAVSCLHLFVLVPLRSAESSIAYHEAELVGRIGRVITGIPLDGFGEVLLETSSGNIAKSAKSFDEEVIAYGVQVLVVESEHGVLSVAPYENEWKEE